MIPLYYRIANTHFLFLPVLSAKIVQREYIFSLIVNSDGYGIINGVSTIIMKIIS